MKLWDECNIEDSIHEATTIQQRIRSDKESVTIANTPFKFKFSARSRIVTHSNAASFSIKTILFETSNIIFSINYWKLGKMNVTL